MEVTQINDHVTHAVIGGMKVIDFSVEDSPELMNVLSKALYTDQELAVARETLCNAWDAHIEAGVTDTPVLVTLTREELIIRDFGFGIPFDRIGPIYGTYGGSTKRKNKFVTGGFGLGCKAPFAFTDHFEVTSWSVEDKHMTIYNMSKSNAEAMGKPGIVPIVRVPITNEQGIQVRIKLNNPHRDYERFSLLIRRIVANGEMNVILNDVQLPVLPFAKADKNFLITNMPVVETTHSILLRYGHVIYPIEMNESYRSAYKMIEGILSRMPARNAYGHSVGGSNHFRIIFQAPANHISITPSRESLSMQEGTIETITALLNEFVEDISPKIEAGCYEVMKEAISTVWLTNAPKVLFEISKKIPNLSSERDAEGVITNTKQVVTRYAANTYPEYPKFELSERIERLDALIASGFGDTNLFRNFRSAFIKSATEGKKFDQKGRKIPVGSDWFKTYIHKPLIDKMILDPEMNPDKLLMYAQEGDHRWRSDYKLCNILNMKQHDSFFQYIRWLRKIVVLTHTRVDFQDRARYFPVMEHWLGSVEETMVYTVSRSPKRVEVARKFFDEMGYTILDLTIAQPWEHQEAAAPKSIVYVAGPKRKGLPPLKSALASHGSCEFKQVATHNTDLVTAPKFVIKINTKSQDHTFPNQSHASTKFVIDQWGKEGGFVVNVNQQAKYIAGGAMHYEDFVLDKIYEQLTTNPRIIESLPYMWGNDPTIMTKTKSYGRHYDYAREHIFLCAIYADPKLVKHFGLVQTMTEDDEMYFVLWNEFKAHQMKGTKDTYKKIETLLASFVVDKKVIKLFDSLRSSKLLFALDADFFEGNLTNSRNLTVEQRDLLSSILLRLIKG